MSLHPGQVVLGHIIGELHAAGSFGRVYAGTDPHGNRVAIKFIPTGGAGASVAELAVVTFVQQDPHPALIGILGFEAVTGGHAVVMEWADGTLQDRLDKMDRGCEPMPAPEALAHVRRIATGLDYLAANGFAHHDVKPANVLLVGGVAKLADFGFAQTAAASLASMAFRGTTQYVPPEVCTGKSAGNRSDQYSLAVMYHWLRRNESPYRELRGRELSPAALIQVHLAAKPSLDGLTGGERATVARALTKDPRKRLHSCSAFVEQLAITDRPEATRTRLRYALSALLVAGLVGLGWLGTLVVPAAPPVAEPPTRAEFDRLTVAFASQREELGGLRKQFGDLAKEDADRAGLFAGQMHDLQQKHDNYQKALNAVQGAIRVAVDEGDKKLTAKLLRQIDRLRREAHDVPSEKADFENLDGDRPPLLICTGEKGVDAKTVEAAQKAWAGFLGENGFKKTFNHGGKAEIEMVLVPPGKYFRGSPKGELPRGDDETQRLITITKPFWVGKYEVTQHQFFAMTDKNESTGTFLKQGEAAKVFPWVMKFDSVHHNKAVVFCEKATILTKNKYRLLSEAEWEYVYRAGTRTRFYSGGTENDLRKVAVYASPKNGDEIEPVGHLGKEAANTFGVFDMAGNVWEWCADWHDAEYYQRSPVNDPVCADSQSGLRVVRGGSGRSSAVYCRAAGRVTNVPPVRNINIDYVGFRVCIPIDK